MARTLVGLLLPLAAGLPFTLRLPSWPSRLGMGFLAGVVIVTGALTIVGAAGLPFNLVTLALPAAVWLAAAGLALRRPHDAMDPTSRKSSGVGWIAWSILAVCALNVVTATAYALRVPISIYDVTVIWLPKAHIIESSGFRALDHSVFPDYPPLWPLHLYLADGGAPWIKLLPAAYLVSTLALVFDYVRARVGPVMAAGCVLVISGIPYLWLPYGVNDLMSDVPTMAFLTASTITLAEYLDRPSRDYLVLMGLAASGAILVRPDGFVHAFALATVAIVVGFLRRRTRETLAAAGALALVYLAWQAVVRLVFQYHGTYRFGAASLDLGADLASLAEITRYAATYIGNQYVFGPALIAGVSILVGYRHWRAFAVVGVVLTADLLSTMAIYVLLPTTDIGQPLTWWLTTGFKREVLHVMPLLYVASAIAFGSILGHGVVIVRPETRYQQRPSWGMAPLPLAAYVVLTSFAIAIAAYAAYRVGGPKTYDLSVMAPSHVSASTLDVSVPGTMLVTTDDTSAPTLVFYLQNTGRRVPPLDNISGVFWRFSSMVAVDSGSVPEQFTASVDGRVIGMTTAIPAARPVTLTGQIPLGGRFLELSVRQLGPGTATASWVRPTVDRASAWWLAEVFLLVALMLVVASGLATPGHLKLGGRGWMAPTAVAILLLAAAGVQQAEAMFEVAMPVWAGAVDLVIHHI